MNYDRLQSTISSNRSSNQNMASLDPRIEVGKLPLNAASESDQPKRPLSSYNIFFQVERQRLISDKAERGSYSRAEVYSICLDKATRIEKSKRPHRKMHGMISFTDLAKTIAEKWKSLDASDKLLFEERADDEKRKYAIELEEWLLRQVPTQQIKKRLSALRRGSLSKFISSKRRAPSSTTPSPSRLPPSSYSDPYNMAAIQHEQSPTRTGVAVAAVSPTTGKRIIRPKAPPSRREIQLHRARNLQRLYQMQIQLYNEQMRLHAECNGDLTATDTSYDFYSHANDGFHGSTPGMVGLQETPRFVSSTNLNWDDEPAVYMEQYAIPPPLPRHHHLPPYELPTLPVQSPFHDHVNGRVSPFDAGNNVMA